MPNKAPLHIVTANHLIGGHSVFFGPDGWTADVSCAQVARDAAGTARLEAVARAQEAANVVVGAYLVAVALDASGAPEPIHYREKLRAKARPSFWAGQPKVRASVRKTRLPTETQHVSL